MQTFSIVEQLLTLIGALGLFLFGMKLMSEALQKVAGSRMRSILGAMTNNRIRGVLTGIFITTTIQSSSATTVMVVSFVNAGLLSLLSAIGVIMGANIGTTVTAWLISIVGFKISLSYLSLPLIGLGFPLIFSKNGKRKSWGEFVIGFAVLFIGLQFLKECVPDIQGNADKLNFLSSFTHLGFLSVVIFVLIGSILTVIIQSSSATMALTLVMCYNGLLPFELAAAMILGENIGTTITANLAAIVANTTAKRAARAHLIFNIFGVVWMLFVFRHFIEFIDFFIERNHGLSLLSTNLSEADFNSIKNVYPIGLSLFHTSFNILNTALLIGFAPFIAKTATRMVPSKGDDDDEFRLKYINAGLFSTSELSIIQAQKEMVTFGERLIKMLTFIKTIRQAIKPKKYYKTLGKIEKYEEITDNLEQEIATYLTKVSEGDISRDSSWKIRAMLKGIDDMESIADAIFHLSRIIKRANEAKIIFTPSQNKNIEEMLGLVELALKEMHLNLQTSFQEVDTQKAFHIEQKINEKRDRLRIQHVEDLKEKKYKHKTGAFYSDIYTLCERLGDYIINVSQAIQEYQKGSREQSLS